MKAYSIPFAILLVLSVSQLHAQDTIRIKAYTDAAQYDTVSKVRYIDLTTNAFHRTNEKGIYASLGTNSQMGGVLALGYTAGSWVSIFAQVSWDDDWSHNDKTKYGLGVVAIVPSESSKWSPYVELLTGTDFNNDLPIPSAEVEPGTSLASTFTTVGFGVRYYFAAKAFFFLGGSYTMSERPGYVFRYSNGYSVSIKQDKLGRGGVSLGLALTGL